MSFERKYYVRIVTVTTVIAEYWSSTAGKPQYIEQDGKKITQAEMSSEPKVTIDFREATPLERALFDEHVRMEERL